MAIKKVLTIGLPVIVLGLSSCTKDPNSPGYEYMPDMYRSPSVDAYLDYNHPDQQSAKVPAAGTVPFSADENKAVFNFPYPFAPKNAAEEADMYEKSAMVKNPIVVTSANLDEVMAKGEHLYLQFCTHCHGDAGDGQGSIVKNGKFNGVPNYQTANIQALPDGKMFHSISYGKGVMGAHAGQLNKEERWVLVHYVKKLRNGGTYPLDSTATAAVAAPVAADSTTNNQQH